MISPSHAFSLTVEAAPGGFTASWTVPSDLPYFEGHFPGNPVLPAVAILDATVECLRRALADKNLNLSAVVSAKFLEIIQPNSKVRIELKLHECGDWMAGWASDDVYKKKLAELRIRL